ncbi:MAG: ABC transporter ATP-binding protein [Nanoarchaeota archaeon]
MKIKEAFARIKKIKKPLSTNRISFSYTNQAILKDITLNLKKSEILAIIGKSGSGKSTFLKLISGIISKKYAGKIKIFGKPKFFKKSKIGFVPQELSFIPDLSLYDNIRITGLNLGLSEKTALNRAEKFLTFLKMDESLNKFPRELSGGQKVRFNIVLSLLHEPEIIVLDEPFVGLDFSNRKLLWHFIESLKNKGKSIILTSHLLTETQEHVDRLIILKNGKILFNGNLERLKQKFKLNYIFEIRFSRLSKDNFNKIKKYCTYKEIPILDNYERYLMIGIKTEKQRKMLLNLFSKLNLQFKEISFREPNLDEIFLKT